MTTVPRAEFGVLRCFDCPARASDLCGGIGDKDLAELATVSKRVHLDAGETLIAEGDESDLVYNVVRGTMMLTRIGADGRRQILAFLFPGHYIGFSSDRLYRFNADAVTKAELCRFERRRLEGLYARHPQMESGIRNIAAKIFEASLDLIYTLGRRSATERVAAFLLYLREAQKTANCPMDGGRVPLDMTRTDIADYLGLTIETVSRVLSRLKAKGLIRLPTLHSFEIANEAALAAAAGITE